MTTTLERHVVVPFSIPLTLMEVVDRYTESLSLDPANKVSSSRVVCDLLRDGLRYRASLTKRQPRR